MSTKGFTKKENQRRYALHRTIRKLGGVVSTKNRTIFIPIEQEELPPPNYRVRQKIRLQYTNTAFYEPLKN